MKKILPYIVGLFLVGTSIYPAVMHNWYAPGEFFQYFVYIAGFLTFHIWFTKINLFVKLLPTFVLVNAMTSQAPLISFVSWFFVIAGVYLYIACYYVDDYKPILKMIQAVLLFTALLYVMKFLGQEPIANFENNVYYGTIGQHMQSGSLTTILTAVAISLCPYNLLVPILASLVCNSAGAFLSAALGIGILMFRKINKEYYAVIVLALLLAFACWMGGGKFHENTNMGNSRLLVWMQTILIGAEHPIMGWGIGTYKIIFPVKSSIAAFDWTFAHNCWLQILFEMGLPGLMYAVIYFLYLLERMITLSKRTMHRPAAMAALAGLIMIASNMVYHFPTRMIQTIPLLIFFLAFCQRTVDNASPKTK